MLTSMHSSGAVAGHPADKVKQAASGLLEITFNVKPPALHHPHKILTGLLAFACRMDEVSQILQQIRRHLQTDPE